MATAALTLVAPVVASPVAANDDAPFSTWTADPRARRLLASCVANPPAGAWRETRYVRSRNLTFAYSGYRAAALQVIRNQHGQRALNHATATDDYTAFERWTQQPSVTDAIDNALNASLDAVREG